MTTQSWVNIGAGTGLLPDGTKPYPEPYRLVVNEVHLGPNSLEVPKMLIHNISLKNSSVKIISLSLSGHATCVECENALQ